MAQETKPTESAHWRGTSAPPMRHRRAAEAAMTRHPRYECEQERGTCASDASQGRTKAAALKKSDFLALILTKVRIHCRSVADDREGVRLDSDFHRDDGFRGFGKLPLLPEKRSGGSGEHSCSIRQYGAEQILH